MKTLLAVLSVFLATTVHAWELEANLYRTIPNDDMVQESTGLQCSLTHKNFYGYIGQEITPIRPGGQTFTDIEVLTGGFGVKHELAKGLRGYAQVGWYEPQYDTKPLKLWVDDGADGLMIYMNHELAPYYYEFDYYSYKLHGNVGGKLGLEYVYELTDNLDLILNGAYRYLQMEEMVKGFTGISLWEYKTQRDFSGMEFGIGLEWAF